MKRFGKYLLFRKISSGGMADVFSAKAIGIRGFTKTVAIKRIFPHLLDRQRFLRMFTDEAKIASRLVHPNIVQIHDLGEQDGVPYIAMEYVAGRDLHLVLHRLSEEEGRFPAQLACRVVAELCEGLHHAHEFRSLDGKPQEIVHRDVSPRNVLLGFDGQVKLTDFGIARARDREEHTEHGLIKGKVRYISPEAAHGLEVDRRSDIFSLGVVFAEMLTLEPFFDAANQIAILLAIREGHIDQERFEKIPRRLRPIVERAIATDPNDRYSSAMAFKEDLLNAIGHQLPPLTELAKFLRELYGHIYTHEMEVERKVERLLAESPALLDMDGDIPVSPELAEELAAAEAEVPDDVDTAPGPFLPLQSAEARTTSASEMLTGIDSSMESHFEGDLSKESVTRVLHKLAIERLGGRIDLRRDPVLKSVFLVDGEPVFAASNVEAELFGEFLVGRGLLSRENHARVLTLAEQKGVRMIAAMLELELFPPHELFEHLAAQIRERILDLFTWTSGKYYFYKDFEPPDAGVPLRLKSLALIHDGVFERVPISIIQRRLNPHLSKGMWIVSDLPSEFALSGREQRIIHLIQGETLSIAELLRRERSEEQVMRLIYLLCETGHVSLEE